MAKFSVNIADKALLDQMALDTDKVLRQGLQANGVDYGTKAIPVPNYDVLVPSGGDAYNVSQDGIKAGLAVSVKYMAPFFAQQTISPVPSTITFRGIPTPLIAFTVTDSISVPRQALVSVQFDIAVSASPAHLLQYWIDVSGTQSNQLLTYITDTNQKHVTGTFVVTLQGTPTITLYAVKNNSPSTGTNFTIDGNSSINMTIAG